MALREPNGLLAAGGCLSSRRLMRAYRAGIFPWYGQGQPILWWSPDPRTVLEPSAIHIGRSLAKRLRQQPFRLRMDTTFDAVIRACAGPRSDTDETWITPAMRAAYNRLYHLGHAHSVEAYADGVLVGGLYGVAVGKVFFGESMFSRAPDASKVALVALCRQLARWGFALIDCQMDTPHLRRMGARCISRDAFLSVLETHCGTPGMPGPWSLADDLETPT